MSYNTNKTSSSCQPENKNNLQLSQILAIELEIRQLNLKAPKKIRIFDTFNEYSNGYDQVFPAQATIAKKSGSSRKHVNETTTEFDYNFWITKHYSHRRTSSYKINPAFKNQTLRDRLKDIIPSFRFFPKSYLISKTNRNNETFQSVEVTPIIVSLNSISISSSELATKVVCPIEKETSFYNRESVSQSFLLKEREKNEERDWRAKELSNFDDVEFKLHSPRKETMTENNYSKTLMTIAEKFHFTSIQIEELDEFDDITLTESLRKMTGRTPNQPFTYFRSICRDVKQKLANKGQLSKPKQVSTDINKAKEQRALNFKPLPENECTRENFLRVIGRIKGHKACLEMAIKAYDDYGNDIDARHIESYKQMLEKDIKHFEQIKAYLDYDEPTPEDTVVLLKEYTPTQMANEISIFLDPTPSKKLSALMGEEATLKYRDSCVRNLLESSIVLECRDDNDRLAEQLINKQRLRLGLQVKTNKNTSPLKEITPSNTMNHKDEKVSTSLEFEHVIDSSMFEEIYD